MIDRQSVMQELEQQGKQHLIDEAARRLPEQVNVNNHEVDLKALGLDPQALAEKYAGSI